MRGVTIYVAAADVPDELRPHRETIFRGQRWFVLESSSGGDHAHHQALSREGMTMVMSNLAGKKENKFFSISTPVWIRPLNGP